MYQSQSNKEKQLFLETKFEEGLHTIRSRITALSNPNTPLPKTGLSQQLDSTMGGTTKRSNTTFLGKLDLLQGKLKSIELEVQESSQNVKSLKNNTQWLQTQLLRQLNKTSQQNQMRVKELAEIVQEAVNTAGDRRVRVQQDCQRNTETSHRIKMTLIEIQHRVERIQNELGSPLMRDKL